MDTETLNYLRHTVGETAGIPEGHRHRLAGESVAELKRDAAKMLVELGLAEPPQRDENGRFTGDLNAAIRQAAGR